MAFSLVSDEEEVDEVVEKLVGNILRQSSGKLRRDMVDLVEREEFFLHGLVGEERRREEASGVCGRQ